MAEPDEISGWSGLVDRLQRLDPVNLACRGQARCYHEMRPRIDRCLTLTDLREQLRVERAVCQRFREHAPIYLSQVERRYLATRWLQLVVMQHYGAPTRLLDWTKSAWVAVFFAVSDEWESDGYVYGFKRDDLEKCVLQNFHEQLKDLVWGPHRSDLRFPDTAWDRAEANDILFDESKFGDLSEWVAPFYSREAHFPRLIAQQGFFTFASRPGLDHWKQISTLLNDDCFVLKISASAKPEILRMLNVIGLNGATLFPGADGIGRSLEGFARAWHLHPRPSQF